MKRVGETELPTLSPDGQEETDELTMRTWTRQWNGSYAKLRAMKPVPGSVIQDGYTVIKSNLKSKPGAQGILTVTMTQAVTRTSGLSAGTAVKASLTNKWVRVQRPLRQHPKWKNVAAETWAGVDNWEKEEDWNIKQKYQYRSPHRDADGNWQHDEDGRPQYDTLVLTGSIWGYCDYIMKGVTTYDDFHPVCTQSRVYSSFPGYGRCGMIDYAPLRVGGYTYMKTEDDISDQGSKGMWTRTECWEGFEEIDAGLYGDNANDPASSPAPEMPAAAQPKRKRK